MTQTVEFSRRGVLFGAAALAACSPKPSAPGQVTLRVADYKAGPRELITAAGLGEAPYKLAWSEFASGNLITEAIDARAIDAGFMSEIPPIFVAGRPSRVKLVAVVRGDVNAQVVLVPKDSPIRSPAELKGKRVGYVRATTSQYLLARLLGEHGLTYADITPVSLTPQDGLSAFGQGSLDAWVVYGAPGALARARLGARVLATGLGRLSGNYVVAALADALDDPVRRAALADHLSRLKRAYAWANDNPAAWASAQAAATGLPVEIYERIHRERSAPAVLGPVDDAAIASQQTVADGFAALGAIPAKVDVRPLWNNTFSKEI